MTTSTHHLLSTWLSIMPDCFTLVFYSLFQFGNTLKEFFCMLPKFYTRQIFTTWIVPMIHFRNKDLSRSQISPLWIYYTSCSHVTCFLSLQETQTMWKSWMGFVAPLTQLLLPLIGIRMRSCLLMVCLCLFFNVPHSPTNECNKIQEIELQGFRKS